MHYILVFLTILLTSFAQIILKYRLNSILAPSEGGLPSLSFILNLLLDYYVILSFALAFFASLSWIAALSRFELSVAYPYMSLSFALVVLLGHFCLGESISVYKISGTLLIVTGVALLQHA